MRLLSMLLAIMVGGIQVWSYDFTNNYTIETKFKINAVAAGIAFRADGINGQICMWQFNVGNDGSQSKFRPHDWKTQNVLLEEKDISSQVALNTTDWFVTKIVISSNGCRSNGYRIGG